jgi:hypothetical protein
MSDCIVRQHIGSLHGKTIDTVEVVHTRSGTYWRIWFTDKTHIDAAYDSLFDHDGMRFDHD